VLGVLRPWVVTAHDLPALRGVAREGPNGRIGWPRESR
jgi:hypothetical protein